VQHISRSLEGASRAGAAAQVHPDKCKHPHATSAFEVLGNANQQLQSEEVMHELRHVLTLARGAPAACACKDVRRGGLCHGALRPHRALGALLSSARADRAADCACLGTEVRAVWGCLEAAACVSRRRPLVRLFSARVPGAASREALGSAVGLVPLGTRDVACRGRCRRAAHASGRCQRRLRQPWLGLPPSRRRLPDGSAMNVLHVSCSISALAELRDSSSVHAH